MKSSEILIAGTIRNGEKSVYLDYCKLKSAFSGFKKIFFLIIESDSSDKTIEILEKIKLENDNFDYISLGNLKSKYPKRTERIAFCRNKYIDSFRENSTYQNCKYLIVSDLDNTNELLSQKSIESCFTNANWDVCTANQNGYYYDIWALRHPLWAPNDCWDVNNFYIESLKQDPVSSKIKTIQSRMIKIPKNAGFIKVFSAFGGLAIYKKEVLFNAQYVGLTQSGMEICEHIFFHNEIVKNGGEIFINSELINCESTIHENLLTKNLILKHLLIKLFPFTRSFFYKKMK